MQQRKRSEEKRREEKSGWRLSRRLPEETETQRNLETRKKQFSLALRAPYWLWIFHVVDQVNNRFREQAHAHSEATFTYYLSNDSLFRRRGAILALKAFPFHVGRCVCPDTNDNIRSPRTSRFLWLAEKAAYWSLTHLWLDLSQSNSVLRANVLDLQIVVCCGRRSPVHLRASWPSYRLGVSLL